MSSLYVDLKNVAVRLCSGALAFYEGEERVGTVPVAPIDRVIFKGGVTLSTSVLGELGEHGIGVIILSGYKNVPLLFFPSAHNDAQRRVCQCCLSLDEEYRRLFSVEIIREKISEQAKLLDRLAEDHPQAGIVFNRFRGFVHKDEERIYKQITMDELRGIEGHASASYFQALAAIVPSDLNFTGRNRRPPMDPLNAALSLTYTLLIADAALAIHAGGLDPYVGFLHALDFSRVSFACDLVESFRPQADLFAMRLFTTKVLSVEDFSITSKGCLMTKEARTRFYPAYEAAADKWRRTLRQKAIKTASDFVTEVAAKHKAARGIAG